MLQVSDTFAKTAAGNMTFLHPKSETLSNEVNRRLVYSTWSIGKGYSKAKKFCTPTARAYQKKCKNSGNM